MLAPKAFVVTYYTVVNCQGEKSEPDDDDDSSDRFEQIERKVEELARRLNVTILTNCWRQISTVDTMSKGSPAGNYVLTGLTAIKTFSPTTRTIVAPGTPRRCSHYQHLLRKQKRRHIDIKSCFEAN